MPEVLGHLAAAAERVVGLAEVGAENLGRRHAEGQSGAEVAVVEAEPVVAALELAAERDLRGLVARGPDVEEALPLLEERQHLLVEPPRGHHRPEDVLEFAGVEVFRP